MSHGVQPGHKIGEQFYVRQDSTRAYYFELGSTTHLTLRWLIMQTRSGRWQPQLGWM